MAKVVMKHVIIVAINVNCILWLVVKFNSLRLFQRECTVADCRVTPGKNPLKISFIGIKR